jgi:LAS superfamily LD-carboxypeptidase LdcB
VSDRTLQVRRSSGGRHRASAGTQRPPFSARLRLGRTAKGALALGLVLSLGGYTVAESATQRESARAAQSVLTAAATARTQTTAERVRAVATARTAVADATAVQKVASASVPQGDLATITDAVARVNALIEQVPANPAPVGPAAPTAAAARASRGVPRRPMAARAAGVTAASAVVGSAAPAAAAVPPPAAPAPENAAPENPAPENRAPSTPPSAAGAPAPGPGDLAAAVRTPVPAGADDAAPTDTVAAGIMVAVARLAAVTAKVQTAAQANIAATQAAAASAAQAAAAKEADAARLATAQTQAAAQAKLAATKAAQAAAAAAKKAVLSTSLDAYANGQVPASALCPIDFAPGQQLRCDAVAPLSQLNASFRATFGADLVVSDSYRSYADQVACSRTKGRLCATPGTSDHGRGVAVDLGSGVERLGSAQSQWMNANAGKFGWIWPDWARPNGSNPEPWQWDFTG